MIVGTIISDTAVCRGMVAHEYVFVAGRIVPISKIRSCWFSKCCSSGFDEDGPGTFDERSGRGTKQTFGAPLTFEACASFNSSLNESVKTCRACCVAPKTLWVGVAEISPDLDDKTINRECCDFFNNGRAW